MTENRQRLIPWLVAKVDSGTIRGLHWLDKERTTFRIPWKHGGKQDWNPEHSAIFMEWAKHTGKYREGVDAPEWAKWKTRLRCAFNKAPEIEEIKERSDVEAINPFKVYKLKPKTKSVKAEKKIKEEYYFNPPASEPMLPETLDEFNRSNNSSELCDPGSLTNSLKGIPSGDLIRGFGDEMQIMSNVSDLSLGENMQPMHADEPVEMDEQVYPTNETNGAPVTPHVSPCHRRLVSSSTLPSTTINLPGHSPLMPNPSASIAQPLDSYAPASSPLEGDTPYDTASFGQSANVTSIELSEGEKNCLTKEPAKVLPLPLAPIRLQVIGSGEVESHVLVERQNNPSPIQEGHEMYVRVQYMNDIVIEEYILNRHGFRLKYGSDSEVLSQENPSDLQNILGSIKANVLHLPPPDGLVSDQRQLVFTEKLLHSTNKGFHVECLNGDIFVTRYCGTVLYYFDEGIMKPVKLARRQRTKVFDLTSYHYRCRQFALNVAPEPPKSEVNISVGQACQVDGVVRPSLISCVVKSALVVQMPRQAVMFAVDDDASSIEMPMDLERTYTGTL